MQQDRLIPVDDGRDNHWIDKVTGEVYHGKPVNWEEIRRLSKTDGPKDETKKDEDK